MTDTIFDLRQELDDARATIAAQAAVFDRLRGEMPVLGRAMLALCADPRPPRGAVLDAVRAEAGRAGVAAGCSNTCRRTGHCHFDDDAAGRPDCTARLPPRSTLRLAAVVEGIVAAWEDACAEAEETRAMIQPVADGFAGLAEVAAPPGTGRGRGRKRSYPPPQAHRP